MSAILPLQMLRTGDAGEVVDVVGADYWVRCLAEKGLRTGSRLKVLTSGEPALCQVEETRLSLRTDGQVEIMVLLNV